MGVSFDDPSFCLFFKGLNEKPIMMKKFKPVFLSEDVNYNYKKSRKTLRLNFTPFLRSGDNTLRGQNLPLGRNPSRGQNLPLGRNPSRGQNLPLGRNPSRERRPGLAPSEASGGVEGVQRRCRESVLRQSGHGPGRRSLIPNNAENCLNRKATAGPKS